jgi:DNA-binding MarR family transcriptional regulator
MTFFRFSFLFFVTEILNNLMTIETRIKQKKFKNNAEKAIVNIAYTQSYFSLKINTVLKTYNISSQQFNVLRIIKGQHPRPVSIGGITSRMIDKMSNTSRLISRLEKKDLVQRVNNPFDGRQINVFLTLRGTRILKKLNALVDSVVNDHSHLSEEELIELNRLLDKIRIE